MVLHEKWSDYTDAEIRAIHRKKCDKCKYHASFSGMRADTYCDYFSITGKLRDTSPDDCEYYNDDGKVTPYHQRDLRFGRYQNYKNRNRRVSNNAKK